MLFWTCQHCILLHRLHHDFGIQGTALKWFSSYLTSLTQSVSTDCYTSEPAPISFSVPHGSVLGPVLFVLYTARLSTVIEKHSNLHHSYADDSQLRKFAPPYQIPDLFFSKQKCIDDVQSSMILNKLKQNHNKTEVMIVSSGRKSRSLSISFSDSIFVISSSVPLSDTVKNPVLTLVFHLTMKTQVSNLVRSTNFELRRNGSIRHLLSTYATKTLVSTVVLSRLDYCNSLSLSLSLSLPLSFFRFRLSLVPPNKTTEGSEQHCSPCHESF